MGDIYPAAPWTGFSLGFLWAFHQNNFHPVRCFYKVAPLDFPGLFYFRSIFSQSVEKLVVLGGYLPNILLWQLFNLK
jgi:hypothetical protein